MLKKFDIVIVNWNSDSQLSECVQSIETSVKENCILKKIIVVDNASIDNSIEQVEALNLTNVEILKNSENLGFGAACNQGAKVAGGDFILFLNPDTMIFEHTFSKLFEYIDNNDTSNVGVFGVQLRDENNNVQKTCARFPSVWNFMVKSMGLNKINADIFKVSNLETWDHKDTKEVDQVIGAFFMIKRSLLEELNGFDERYFVYYEELDLSKRVCEKGYKTLFVSESYAFHKGGGTSEQVKAKRLFYNLRSRIIYSLKHFGLFLGLFTMLFTYLIEPITRTLFLMLKGKRGEVKEALYGFFLLYKDTFNIVQLGIRND